MYEVKKTSDKKTQPNQNQPRELKQTKTPNHQHKNNPKQNKEKRSTHAQDTSLLECIMLHSNSSTFKHSASHLQDLALYQAYPLSKTKIYIKPKHFWGWESFVDCAFSYFHNFKWFVHPLSERDYRHGKNMHLVYPTLR